MISYWDTSALIPLLVQEPTSEACRRLWDATSSPVSTRLLHVESAAALHQAHRLGRIDPAQLKRLLADLGSYWEGFNVVELDGLLARSAAKLAGKYALRGYDAVHCAAGLAIAADPIAVLVSGDARLLAAWRSEGAATYSTSPA
jgi:uncharacterized protein